MQLLSEADGDIGISLIIHEIIWSFQLCHYLLLTFSPFSVSDTFLR